MLVLSRKQEERICIGPDVVITILRLSNDTVRIGIDAPKEVLILRGELTARTAADAAGETPTPAAPVVSP